MKIRVAGAQIPVTNDVAENRLAVLRAVEFAAANGADILLTPEGSVSGYTHLIDQRKTEAAVDEIRKRAAKHAVGLALGTCFEEADGRCYNQLRFYDTDGSYLGFHSKTLTCGTPTDPPVGEINHFAVSPLRTFTFKGVTCGGLICNDLWADPLYTPMPDTHLSQQLSAMGAKIIFHAVNGGRDGSLFSRGVTMNYHESNLIMRAKAAKSYMVTVDNSDPSTLPCSSPGGVVGPDGTWLAQCPLMGEQYFVHDIVIQP
jgi:predicted amidohydrolase